MRTLYNSILDTDQEVAHKIKEHARLSMDHAYQRSVIYDIVSKHMKGMKSESMYSGFFDDRGCFYSAKIKDFKDFKDKISHIKEEIESLSVFNVEYWPGSNGSCIEAYRDSKKSCITIVVLIDDLNKYLAHIRLDDDLNPMAKFNK